MLFFVVAQVWAVVKTLLVVFTSVEMGRHVAIAETWLSIHLLGNVTLPVYKSTVITFKEGIDFLVQNTLSLFSPAIRTVHEHKEMGINGPVSYPSPYRRCGKSNTVGILIGMLIWWMATQASLGLVEEEDTLLNALLQ